jgi:gas vesicle protein
MNTRKALMGVAAGLAAGVILGVLFAPEKGAKSRKKLSRKGEDLVDAINEEIDDKFQQLLSIITDKVKLMSKNDLPATRKTELANNS